MEYWSKRMTMDVLDSCQWYAELFSFTEAWAGDRFDVLLFDRDVVVESMNLEDEVDEYDLYESEFDFKND